LCSGVDLGNLRLVQFGHASIKNTTRYAHVLDNEVAEAIERVAASRKPSQTKIRMVK
jgi:site-specific recombinase XerD